MNTTLALRRIVGDDHVLTGDAASPFLTDWTGHHTGTAEAVVQPNTTELVSAILRLAQTAHLPVTVQSGNTSVSGGSVPVRPGGIVLSLARLNRIREIDTAARTATVDAGAIVQGLQDAAEFHGLTYPLMFGARGTALIGGALSTNAGGANVLRYGTARDLCLGIEAVLPDGRMLNRLTGLRKDNTGYDLKNLLIGAEGTLGVITGAVLKLVPIPRVRVTAFLSLSGLSAALDVLNALQDASGGLVEAFEWLPGNMVDAILVRNPALRAPLQEKADTGVLVELASTRVDDAASAADGAPRLRSILLKTIGDLMERGHVLDGTLAATEGQRQAVWAVREAVLGTIVAQGRFTVIDAALPLARVEPFVTRAAPIAERAGLAPMLVGHLGDGNVHYATTARPGTSWDEDRVAAFTENVLDLLAELGGTYSAEHGIGRSKTSVLKARKDPAQFDLMRRIKAAIDPNWLLNPGVLFHDCGGSEGAGSPTDNG